jgi:hypothetical protein
MAAPVDVVDTGSGALVDAAMSSSSLGKQPAVTTAMRSVAAGTKPSHRTVKDPRPPFARNLIDARPIGSKVRSLLQLLQLGIEAATRPFRVGRAFPAVDDVPADDGGHE